MVGSAKVRGVNRLTTVRGSGETGTANGSKSRRFTPSRKFAKPELTPPRRRPRFIFLKKTFAFSHYPVVSDEKNHGVIYRRCLFTKKYRYINHHLLVEQAHLLEQQPPYVVLSSAVSSQAEIGEFG